MKQAQKYPSLSRKPPQIGIDLTLYEEYGLKLQGRKFLLTDKCGINLPSAPHVDDPLSWFVWEWFDLRLRLFETKVRTGLIRVTSWDEEARHFDLDSVFDSRLGRLAGTHTEQHQELLDTLKNELLWHIRMARQRSRLPLRRARVQHGSKFSLQKSLREPIHQDIYVLAVVHSGLVDGKYVTEHRRYEKSVTISSLIRELSVLYGRLKLQEELQPQSSFFSEGVLDIDFRDLEKPTWEDARILIPPYFWTKLGQKFPGTSILANRRMSQVLEPKADLTEVILPENLKEDIEKLCSLYLQKRESPSPISLTFLFKGMSGAGKSITAMAIAKRLGLSVLRLNFSDLSPRLIPAAVALFCERARASRSLLLFEESEDLLGRNLNTGSSDSWLKILFEDFRGVAVFTTNYEVAMGHDRRMTMVVTFKMPPAEDRVRILSQEIERMKRDHRLTKVPSQELIQKIAEQFSVPGGYYDQLLKLSLARGNGSEINVETLTEVFRAREAQLNNSASNAIQIPQVKLEDIHLEPRQRQIVERFIEYARALTSSPPASRLFPQGATALFTGPAGVGKTVTAEAIAKSLGMKIWRVSPSTILSKWVGESEQNIRAIFRNAHRSSHVLFLDEAEGILLDRQGATHSWQRTQVDELLQQIESFNGVLIAASNCPEMIDTAFARRFIFHIRLTSPDIPTRRQLWGMWRNVLRLSDNDLDVLAERYQLSGGQIRNIAIRAVAHGQTELQSILALSDEMSRDLTGISRRPLGIHLH